MRGKKVITVIEMAFIIIASLCILKNLENIDTLTPQNHIKLSQELQAMPRA